MNKHWQFSRLALYLFPACLFAMPTQVQAETDPLLDLDLEQLMRVKLQGSVTLTPTAARRQPASITTITRTMIADSGARNLFDLFDIYVPNFQWLPHHWEASHMGMRGIIGDREDKFLLVVNGRVLNEKTHFGALSERDLPMLADIRRIDVVRGPGSVIYGPGAVSMVINIQTDTFADHGEDTLVVKQGVLENFTSLELKKAIPLSSNARHGLLLYAGITDYEGADNDRAPLVYGYSASTTWGQPVQGGKPVSFGVPDNHESHRDQARIKLHAHYQQDDFNAWMRYTRGGEKLTWEHKIFYTSPNGFAAAGTTKESLAEHSVGYEQFTLDLSQLWTLNSSAWVEFKGGYDTTIYERILWDSYRPGKTPENHREEEFLARVTLNWNPASGHALALGSEAVYSRWGLNSGRADQPVSFTLGTMQPWDNGAYGVFGEYQWQMASRVTQFFGLRGDKDDYTHWMWSPRWAMVATVSDRDTVKGILTRSIRKNNAEELRGQHLAGQDSEHESVAGAELIYSRTLSEKADLQVSAFRNKATYVGIDFTSLHSRPVADFTYGGWELELGWRGQDWNLAFSHAYSKLFHFQVAPNQSTRIAATHLGYGNDLNNWSNHNTKLSGSWAFADHWKFTGNIRILWGYPGAEDHINQVRDARAVNPKSSSTGNLADPGYDESVDSAAFVDLGLRYQLAPRHGIDFFAYNVLGFFDKSLNKRPYLLNVSNYRAEAAAFAVNYSWAF